MVALWRLRMMVVATTGTPQVLAERSDGLDGAGGREGTLVVRPPLVRTCLSGEQFLPRVLRQCVAAGLLSACSPHPANLHTDAQSLARLYLLAPAADCGSRLLPVVALSQLPFYHVRFCLCAAAMSKMYPSSARM